MTTCDQMRRNFRASAVAKGAEKVIRKRRDGRQGVVAD
jgi:hypothetical protein